MLKSFSRRSFTFSLPSLHTQNQSQSSGLLLTGETDSVGRSSSQFITMLLKTWVSTRYAYVSDTGTPKSVQMKRPFAIHPWIDSEENVGNLLMAWRFLITFADVLRLWPFTLDEFVQALHDYESRLLGEIHVALLKSIIKDIEDVARTTVTGLWMNQYSASHLEGGHLQIVEGAYSWGFDIRSW
ncbi:homeobox-DDT domain protein RLT1-like [Hibiscus syriacus]|uniref:homeobox-DDT domain protein RLT1-like n=1 Tax=Hibiscus syriacus TaxID=106335 RepID=UPI001920F3A0|nr:homeobox-DDT domain protein RLT1-like [Hibiscus syriacus]